MDKCEHGNLTAHGRDCPWCKITQQAERIAELEAELKRLREGIAKHQAMYDDCGVDEDDELWSLLEKE